MKTHTIRQSDRETLRIFRPLPPEEITRLARLRQASAKLRSTVEAGTAELERARGDVAALRPAPGMQRIVRWHFFFASVALLLFVGVALFGERMPFDTACDLLVVMLSALITALVLLVLIIVADCRAKKASRVIAESDFTRKGGAL